MILELFFKFVAHCADGGSGDGLSPSDLVNGLNSFTAADPKEKYRLESLPQQVQDTFAAILDNSVLEKRLYWNTPSGEFSKKIVWKLQIIMFLTNVCKFGWKKSTVSFGGKFWF